jgi:hypothetical protein
MKTRLIQNDSDCGIIGLDRTILSSVYSRRVGNSLEVYDSELNLVIVMSFVSDIDLSLIEVQRQKAIDDAKRSE